MLAQSLQAILQCSVSFESIFLKQKKTY